VGYIVKSNREKMYLCLIRGGGPEALADAKSAKAATEKKSFRFSLYKDLVKEAVKVTKAIGELRFVASSTRNHRFGDGGQRAAGQPDAQSVRGLPLSASDCL
jgi:hypothetical protein